MGINPPDLGDPLKVLEVTLGARPEDVAEDVVVTPFFPLNSFLRHAEGEVRELSPRFFYKGFTAKFRGKRFTALLTGVGPSRVGDLISILSLTGCARVVFVGAVGALNPDWAIGDAVLAKAAADGEGYTRYASGDFASIVDSAPVVEGSEWDGEGLTRELMGHGLAVRSGRIFTIGSIAFEERANLIHLRDRGYDAIEMELSAFYSSARRHGLRASALTYVSDLPLFSSLWQEKSQEEKAALSLAWRALPLAALAHATGG